MHPTIERLHELFRYEPETGKLLWRVKPNRRIRVGSEAGCADPRGYVVVGVDGVQVYAHQVVWALNHNTWPIDEIDHRSRKKNANLIENLRQVGRAGNVRNSVKKNKTGFRGVYRHAKQPIFAARIVIDGKAKHLGWHKTPVAAARAYDQEVEKLDGAYPTNQSLGLLPC